MENISLEHIHYFRKILQVKPKDSATRIDINFENDSLKFHPSVRPSPKLVSHFENMVVAREFLKYKLEHKEWDDLQIVENWNEYEKAKVEELVISYKQMSREEFEKAVSVDFVALNVLKIFLYVILGISTLFGIFLIVYLFTSGSSIAGMFSIILVIIVVAAFILRGTGKPNLRRRKIFNRKL